MRRLVPMLVLMSTSATAATLTVPGQYGSLQQAVNNAIDGDVIEISSGTYNNNDIDITSGFGLVGLTIRGVGSSKPVLRGQGNNTIIRIVGNRVVDLENVELNGLGDNNVRGVWAEQGAEVTLTDVDVIGMQQQGSGGQASGVGMRIQNNAKATVIGGLFDNNRNDAFGTGQNGGHINVFNGSELIVDGTTFSNGYAYWGGAVRVASSADADIRNATFLDNNARDAGGAISTSNDTTIYLENVEIDGGNSRISGGINLFETDLAEFVGVTVRNTTADENGAAVSVQGMRGPFVVTDSVFENNIAVGEGGGLRVIDPSNTVPITIERSTFLNNGADGHGAGVDIEHNWGQLTFRDNVVSGNNNSGGQGGGLRVIDGRDTLIVGNKFCYNTVSGGGNDGGAANLAQMQGSPIEFTNNLVVGNATLGGGDGGGLRVTGDASVMVYNNTFVANASADQGAAVSMHNGSIGDLRNNIFLSHSEGEQVYRNSNGGGYTADYNLWWDNSIDQLRNGDPIGPNSIEEDPLLSGFTDDGDCNNDELWPMLGSPAIDAGDTTLGLDPDSSDPDIGAYGGPSALPNPDSDGDGFRSDIDDCDDTDPNVNPSATEVCNDIDDNCDGDVDEGLADTYYADVDGDTYGDDATADLTCSPPTGWITSGGDCDDNNTAVNEGEVESCDGLDNDCNGFADDGVGPIWYADSDVDGFGDVSNATQACTQPTGYVADNTDCDDTDPDTFPGQTWYKDADEDGVGTDTDTRTACAQPSTYVIDSGDCDDTNDKIAPGLTEVCDGLDNDCLGGEDDGLTFIDLYRDLDSDGFGDASTSLNTCQAVTGYVLNDADCNDTNDTISPDGTEVCDGVDQDCDGTSDNGLTFFDQWRDVDGDTYGDPSALVNDCRSLPNHVLDSQDCDDTDSAINPAAQEICNTVDDDCDSLVDNDDPSIDTSALARWYLDGDVDGYGLSTDWVESCDAISGRVLNSTDCDDGNTGVNPGADEVCNDIDDDCDILADDDDDSLLASSTTTWYLDDDDDSYGRPTNGVDACDAPADHVADNTDCDDTVATTYPGASEIPGDGVDQNCDGVDAENCDRDGDGFEGSQCSGDDCDDDVAAFNPAATEVWYDGFDQDCDGWNDWDSDRDGFDSTPWGTDCDDDDATINTDAIDIPDNDIDENCDGVDADVADTDGDGLDDEQEADLGTDPTLADTDGDGIDDGEEVDLGTDPLDADMDDDDVNDGEELDDGTDPNDADSDDDGLDDGEERDLGTDPLEEDTDDDGLDDGEEVDLGTDPLLEDTDGDGLKDATEVDLGTDPLLADTDGDGSNDGADPAPLDNGGAQDVLDAPDFPDDIGCGCDSNPRAPWSLGLLLMPLLVRRREQ